MGHLCRLRGFREPQDSIFSGATEISYVRVSFCHNLGSDRSIEDLSLLEVQPSLEFDYFDKQIPALSFFFLLTARDESSLYLAFNC